jgi:hypothetical protein
VTSEACPARSSDRQACRILEVRDFQSLKIVSDFKLVNIERNCLFSWIRAARCVVEEINDKQAMR